MLRMLGTLSQFLPTSPGLLPKWQLFVTVLAIFNSVQNFATLNLTRRVYNNVPPMSITALHARTFAAWTLTSAMVRAYGAYHINDKSIYDMTMMTYLIAFGHFTAELLIFRTAKFGAAVAGPCVVATISLIWMIRQYDFYVKP